MHSIMSEHHWQSWLVHEQVLWKGEMKTLVRQQLKSLSLIQWKKRSIMVLLGT